MKRKTSVGFFVTCVPGQQSNEIGGAGNSYLGANLSAVPEPKTALTSMTKGTAFTVNSTAVTQGRHRQQGPMRSEKVYHFTNLLKQKTEQLESEKAFIKEHYEDIDDHNDDVKAEIRQMHSDLLQQQNEEEELFKIRCGELDVLNKK